MKSKDVSTQENSRQEHIGQWWCMRGGEEEYARDSDRVVTEGVELFAGVGKVIDRFPCILFGAKVFPLDKPFIMFATSVVSMCDNFVDFPFLILVAGVVNDDVRDWFFSVAIGIIFVRFEVGNRNNRVDFPCMG